MTGVEPQAPECAAGAAGQGQALPAKLTPHQFREQMQMYYGRAFPCDAMCRWLSYGHGGKTPACDNTFFKRREFCFTLDGDVFVRYRSYQNSAELKRALCDKVPCKIDIGPVYTQDPSRRQAYQHEGVSGTGFKAIERELVFDIDLTDYDDVRNSSSGTGMSKQCWILMYIAIQVLDHFLREHFGFEHILWVYSGRRGVHCWVCDERARSLKDEERAAIASHLAIYKGQEKGMPKLALTARNSPLVETAYDILLKHWNKVLQEQRLLTTERTRKLMLQFLPEGDVPLLERQLATIQANQEPEEADEAMWELLAKRAGTVDKKQRDAWKKALQSIVFAFCYPRIDAEVSKKTNHLLKAPFCVHPKTSKVCVPIDIKQAADFDPETVPRLEAFCSAAKACPSDINKIYEETGMQPYVAVFTEFLERLEAESCQKLVQAARDADARSLQW